MKKILIVDDEQGIRENLKMYLEYNENDGFEVTCASYGLEAVKLCENQNFDLVIMDIMMPKMDGYEFTRTLRETNNNLPILMVSAKELPSDKKHGFLVATDDYMTKPSDEE